jgi:hypothetical protein
MEILRPINAGDFHEHYQNLTTPNSKANDSHVHAKHSWYAR